MLFCSIFDISGQINKTSSYKTKPPTFYGCQRFKMTSGDLNKSSGDYLRIEICSCESLLIICTNWIRVQQTPFHVNTILERPFWVSGEVCWCRLVSVGV